MSVNQVSDDTLRPSVWGDSGLLGRVMSAGSRRHVPVLKQGFVFFNYKTSQVVAMPEEFESKFERVNWID